MCSEPGFGARVSGSLTTTDAGSPSRPRLWAARHWPRLRPLPHQLRLCAVVPLPHRSEVRWQQEPEPRPTSDGEGHP